MSNFEKVGAGYSLDLTLDEAQILINLVEQLLELLEFDFGYHSAQDIPKGYQFFTCGNKNKWLPGWQPKYNLSKGIEKYKEYLNDQI